MASKIVLNASRDIPFNKLRLSQANVRRVKAGVNIEDLAEDIARRGLLQSLSVRPVLDGSGQETGMFEVPAGGRRYRALENLVKQKRLAKTAPVPCVMKLADDAVSAEEDSLAENVRREALHPLDQFRAFQALREEKGLDDEAIAARFFVPVQVVRQRLKLAAVSPKLLELYAEDQMTLEQLMAFTVTGDHARQEQVWEALSRSPYKEAYQIRRMLTDGAVRASDKRAQFVGIDAYAEAGGTVMRDLFQADDGGWLQDPVLLDQLVIARLEREAEAVRAEGWKWVEVAPDFAYGHTNRLRRLQAEVALTDEERVAYDSLQQEYAQIEEQYADSPDALPDEVDARLGEIETALDVFHTRMPTYEPDDIARAGAFVSIDGAGRLKVDRGYVRPEDEAPIASPEGEQDANASEPTGPDGAVQRAIITVGGGAQPPVEAPGEEDGLKPLPDRLLTELTAHRTLALRDALANDPETAFLAVLHALALKTFYRFAAETCLEIELKSASLGAQTPGLADTAYAKAVDERHKQWADQFPRKAEDLWDALAGFDGDSRRALFAHCAALSVNAMHETWNRRPRAMAHADRLARAAALDMASVGWKPTAETYLGRVTKARILDAVREAKGEQAAQLIDHLKKPDMAKEAERLLEGTGWVPEPLRTPAGEPVDAVPEPGALPAFLSEEDEAGADDKVDPIPAAQAIAAAE